MDSALARADFYFILKSWQEVQFELGEMLLGKTGKPHLHGIMLTGKCMYLKDPNP